MKLMINKLNGKKSELEEKVGNDSEKYNQL